MCVSPRSTYEEQAKHPDWTLEDYLYVLSSHTPTRTHQRTIFLPFKEEAGGSRRGLISEREFLHFIGKGKRGLGWDRPTNQTILRTFLFSLLLVYVAGNLMMKRKFSLGTVYGIEKLNGDKQLLSNIHVHATRMLPERRRRNDHPHEFLLSLIKGNLIAVWKMY